MFQEGPDHYAENLLILSDTHDNNVSKQGVFLPSENIIIGSLCVQVPSLFHCDKRKWIRKQTKGEKKHQNMFSMLNPNFHEVSMRL